MLKPHPLTRLQSLFAILVIILFCLLAISDPSSQFIWLLASTVPVVGISLVTIYLGWLMFTQKESIIEPYQLFAARIVKRVRGQQAAENLLAAYAKPSRQKFIGVANIVAGLFCLVLAIAAIISLLRNS